MIFNYYFGNESEQFSFIRIPRELLVNKVFASLYINAKMLYGILLDRMGLSMRNGWFDDQNRVYIIYKISEIMQDLGFTKKKAIESLAELEKFGLVEKKKRGLGLPSILYVKNFIIPAEENHSLSDTTGGVDSGTSEDDIPSEREKVNASSAILKISRYKNPAEESDDNTVKDDEFYPDDTVSESGKARNYAIPGNDRQDESLPEDDEMSGDDFRAFRSADFGTTRGVDFRTSRSVDFGTTRGIDYGTSGGAVFGTSGGVGSGTSEVPVSEPLKNKTEGNYINTNNTYESNIQSNPFSSASASGGQGRSDEMRKVDAYAKIIRENIEMDILLKDYPNRQEIIEEIYSLILETVTSSREKVVIASDEYPMSLVKAKFLKLNAEHIRYVMMCLGENTTKVRNIKNICWPPCSMLHQP